MKGIEGSSWGEGFPREIGRELAGNWQGIGRELAGNWQEASRKLMGKRLNQGDSEGRVNGYKFRTSPKFKS
jgi:hypothetical protein